MSDDVAGRVECNVVAWKVLTPNSIFKWNRSPEVSGRMTWAHIHSIPSLGIPAVRPMMKKSHLFAPASCSRAPTINIHHTEQETKYFSNTWVVNPSEVLQVYTLCVDALFVCAGKSSQREAANQRRGKGGPGCSISGYSTYTYLHNDCSLITNSSTNQWQHASMDGRCVKRQRHRQDIHPSINEKTTGSKAKMITPSWVSGLFSLGDGAGHFLYECKGPFSLTGNQLLLLLYTHPCNHQAPFCHTCWQEHPFGHDWALSLLPCPSLLPQSVFLFSR